MLTLVVSHHIFLDNIQLHNLLEGQTVEVMGWNVPVWFYKTNTSEPANEVFCKYTLSCLPPEQDFPPTVHTLGYKININPLPDGFQIPMRPIGDNRKALTKADMIRWEETNPIPDNLWDLKPVDQGGKGMLKFQRYEKTVEHERRMNIVHTVVVAPLSLLEESISL